MRCGINRTFWKLAGNAVCGRSRREGNSGNDNEKTIPLKMSKKRPAFRVAQHAGNQVEHRGLARAVRPDHCPTRAARYGETQVLNDGEAAKVLAHAF